MEQTYWFIQTDGLRVQRDPSEMDPYIRVYRLGDGGPWDNMIGAFNYRSAVWTTGDGAAIEAELTTAGVSPETLQTWAAQHRDHHWR